MDFKLPLQVQTILNKFKDANYQIYIVGGAVRDLLMGREVNDWDFTTDAKPKEILKLFPKGFYNNQFGTVGIVAKSKIKERRSDTRSFSGAKRHLRNEHVRSSDFGGPDPEPEIYEITTMRKEGEYSDTRHPDQVSWTNKIGEDLARRDFTINALAMDANGKIIDPFEGQKDLKEKIIRAVGDPEKRFKEDALRLMRALRFATQLQFTLDEQTFRAIQDNSQLIEQISWERIRDELFKILATDYPYEGIMLLRSTGLLQYILPELERCFGIIQEGPKHDRVYDIGKHSLLSLKETPSKDPLVRFATLIHDIGKPDTMRTSADGNVTFYGHDIVGGRLALQVAKRLKLSKKDTERVVNLVRFHMFTLDEKQTDSAIRRFIKNIGVDYIDDMMALRVGDRLGGGTQKAVSWRMEEFKKRINQVLEKPFSVTDLKVNGKDVMEVLKIKPGEKVGEVLNTLFQEVLEDDKKNNKEYLLERIKEVG